MNYKSEPEVWEELRLRVNIRIWQWTQRLVNPGERVIMRTPKYEAA